jgi:hypothetical protein
MGVNHNDQACFTEQPSNPAKRPGEKKPTEADAPQTIGLLGSFGDPADWVIFHPAAL